MTNKIVAVFKAILPYDIQTTVNWQRVRVWSIFSPVLLLLIVGGVLILGKHIYLNDNKFFYSMTITSGKDVYQLSCNDADSTAVYAGTSYWNPTTRGNVQSGNGVSVEFTYNGQDTKVDNAHVEEKFVYMKDFSSTGCDHHNFIL